VRGEGPRAAPRTGRGTSRAASTPTTSAPAESAKAIWNPLSRGRPSAARLAAITLAAIVEPSAPPTVRMIVFMPVAMPVWCGETASTMRFAIEANASPMPMPRIAEAT
jgi:hypothetical protein